MLKELDGKTLSSTEGFGRLLDLYYKTMLERPEFPKLILKVLALNQGPGRRFIHQLLERGRSQGGKHVGNMKSDGEIPESVDPDVLRMTFVSISITPLLLKDIFEEQMERDLDADFFARYAEFNGNLLASGLKAMQQN
jgi:hypothetical protein